MRLSILVCLTLIVLAACKNPARIEMMINNKVIANEFLDAFYSFNRDSLASILSDAKGSQPNILYYQGWAECGNYKIVKRNEFIVKNDSLFLYPITVQDDLMKALQIDFNVTDTFHITVINGRIRSVDTSSNDLDEYYMAKEWVKLNYPEYIEKQCEGIWEGGPTPCECIKGMIKGFVEYTAVVVE